MYKKNLIVFLILIIFVSKLFAADQGGDNDGKEEPPAIGNYLLSPSQQPGPFLSFAQNIMDKNQFRLNLPAIYYNGDNKYSFYTTPEAVYQLTDKLVVLFSVPYYLANKEESDHSSGVGDTVLQLEYAYYSNSTRKYTDQATVVFATTLPSGSINKSPATGLGSPAFFMGATYNRMWVYWYAFVSPGVLITTSNHGVKAGNQYYYQGGFGRHIVSIGKNWNISWLLEANGQFMERTKVDNILEPNSGGNILYAVPSLLIASKHLYWQLGPGFPVTQHLFGNQKRERYLLATNIGWTF